MYNNNTTIPCSSRIQCICSILHFTECKSITKYWVLSDRPHPPFFLNVIFRPPYLSYVPVYYVVQSWPPQTPLPTPTPTTVFGRSLYAHCTTPEPNNTFTVPSDMSFKQIFNNSNRGQCQILQSSASNKILYFISQPLQTFYKSMLS